MSDKVAVIDASVMLVWLLPDEDQTPLTSSLLDDYQEGLVSFMAPTLLWHEVANALRSAVKQGRIDTKGLRSSIRMFEEFQISFTDLTDNMELVVDTAVKHDLSSYDASYLVLAKIHRMALHTLDKKLMLAYKKSR